MSVAAILRHKAGETVTVTPAMTLAEAATQLSQHRIGAAPVMEGDTLAGIVSERDIVHFLARHGAAALDMPVRDAMSRAVQTATPRTTIPEAMSAMTAGRFRHLPVMEEARMVGIISIGDVVKARLDEQANEVESLRAYVAGG
jgi:CBS domain-containing protein